mmetsp:Transcript_1452/g.2427  ORF Transcript_1452/g.2427 Transcript_1452/m.2427 type:complete len:366 (-) Transcript_1452:34-1131(-)
MKSLDTDPPTTPQTQLQQSANPLRGKICISLLVAFVILSGATILLLNTSFYKLKILTYTTLSRFVDSLDDQHDMASIMAQQKKQDWIYHGIVNIANKPFSVSLENIIQIAEHAGQIILEIYDSDVSTWDQQMKSNDTPLTKADIKANDYISAELKKMYPEIPIMTEEEEAANYAIRQSWKYYWCVDPLDGTKEFIKRAGDFTVNIALMYENQGVLGVVHTPVRKETHFGAIGVGAYVRRNVDKKPEIQDSTRIQVKEFRSSDAGLTLVCSKSHLDERTEAFMKTFKDPKTVSMGSSLKFLLVAEGVAHVYPRYGPTMEWDTAASQVIVEQAGGVVVNAETNQPLLYNKENLLNPYFICYGRKLEP